VAVPTCRDRAKLVPTPGLQPIPAFRPDAYDPAFYASNRGHLKPGFYLFGTLADGHPVYQFSSARTTPEAAAAVFETLWPGTVWTQFFAADNITQLPPDVCEAMAVVDASWRDAAGLAAIPMGEASTPIASAPGSMPAA